MLIDNENKNPKVYEWINKFTEEGELDVVTGYFTIGALAYLSSKTNEKINKFRFVLGDIVNIGDLKDRPLDLLNENISTKAALKLNTIAKEAVRFLKQNNVEVKTLEPNFCHAKVYLHNAGNDERLNYYISGSSNLTEAGIGLKETNNVELNIAETGDNNQYKELYKWFDDLWEKPQTHLNKTLIDEKGKKTKINFKKYLISEIEKIFIEYSPKEIYYKILFELFGERVLEGEDDPDFRNKIGRLENSVIYNSLYDFQQKGVLSMIKTIQKYNGAILADAVGLGKTWSALAVMKFFQQQGREIILLCPKKLEYNWRRYLRKQESRFEKDEFEFDIRFHTDLMEERMMKYNDRADKFFTNEKPKLLVIDESHNLRNDKSNRYKFLMENMLQKNEDLKVLMLSATPINNNLNDIRNQFKMIVKGNRSGFSEKLGVRNLDYSFKQAQKAFNEWRQEDNPRISDFIKQLPSTFFTLTDNLTLARTRKMVTANQNNLVFPKAMKPKNLFVTPKELGNYESFEELMNSFPPKMSGYQPSFYLQEEEEIKSAIEDEKQRDRFLVKMMYILMVKRLESSWYSFYSTVEKIKDHHQNALNKIKDYLKNKDNNEFEVDENQIFEDDDFESEIENYTLGKKRKINLSDIYDAGNMDAYKNDLKKDLRALDNLYMNMQKFNNQIEKELIKPKNLKSADRKLEVLLKEINNKQNSGENNNNQKLVIFTVYRDTADYLFKQLKSRGYSNFAMVSGSGSKTYDSDEETKNFEQILERFAPYTKLFKEKEWKFDAKDDSIDEFNRWIEWISENDENVYNKIKNPIDILIATDALSEGQNMQDADMVINYDIHWNPVRIVQRMGRIDRLGSPNDKIFGINFWPSDNINTYLDLQGRIEQRMAAMKLAGSEVQMEFSETFKEIAEDQDLENRLKARMMQQMQTSWDDIDVSDQSLGFDDLSLEKYRQDLLEEFNKDSEKYKKMPNGIFSGFKADKNVCSENGLIALLGYPTKPQNSVNHIYEVFDLAYINTNGEMVLKNHKEVLDAITHHKDYDRNIPENIVRGDKDSLDVLVKAMKKYLDSQAYEYEKADDGSTKKKMGRETKDLLSKLRGGDKSATERLKQNLKADEKFQLKNFDLITWFYVS